MQENGRPKASFKTDLSVQPRAQSSNPPTEGEIPLNKTAAMKDIDVKASIAMIVKWGIIYDDLIMFCIQGLHSSHSIDDSLSLGALFMLT